jgi:hypothetical protein
VRCAIAWLAACYCDSRVLAEAGNLVLSKGFRDGSERNNLGFANEQFKLGPWYSWKGEINRREASASNTEVSKTLRKSLGGEIRPSRDLINTSATSKTFLDIFRATNIARVIQFRYEHYHDVTFLDGSSFAHL